MGAQLIMAMLFAALILLLHSLNRLIYGRFSEGPLHIWVLLLLAAPIIRFGLAAGGLTVTPIFGGTPRAKRPQEAGADGRIAT